MGLIFNRNRKFGRCDQCHDETELMKSGWLPCGEGLWVCYKCREYSLMKIKKRDERFREQDRQFKEMRDKAMKKKW